MGRRYLEGSQTLLVDQNISGAKGLNKTEIESLYENRPNAKILFITWSPYVDLYQLGLKAHDTAKYERKKLKYETKFTSKIEKAIAKENTKKERSYREKLQKKLNKQNRNIKEGNQAMRLGEPLSIFDTIQEEQTVKKIKNYLFSKGYFSAEVGYDYEETFKLVTSTYTINRNKPYIIDSIFYTVADDNINALLQKHVKKSIIKKGNNYQQEELTEERNRINSLMLNNGYYNFNRQYISFAVDSSSLGDNKIAIGIKVLNPKENGNHKVFKIDSVIFTTDADVRNRLDKRNFNTRNGVKYLFYSKRYSDKILDRRIFLYPDSAYSQKNTFETQQQLSNMDIFKFINVNYDTTGGLFIAKINTIPLNKYQTSTELGLNVSQGLPGPLFNMSIKNRNTFKGLEITELGGRVGFEGLSGARNTGNPYSSLDYGINLAVTFPQFIFPLKTRQRLALGKYNPKSRLSAGLTYNNRIEDYLRRNIFASWSYLWQGAKKDKNYTLRVADINFINSSLTSTYREFLEGLESQGNNLILSFVPSFVNSTWFSATHNVNDYGNKKQSSAYLRYQIESGGNILYSLSNLEAVERDSIAFFRFARVNFDFRRTTPLTSITTLAYRINAGVAVSYDKNRTLPYEKFYFAGGSNSIRAWNPRRLGPGSYISVDSLGNYDDSFEQPGEVLLEASIEYRHKLFGPIYGAFFLDAGNSWMLYEDPTRPGSQFKFDKFYKQIAVGGGYGVRVDISFLILRLDAAWKIIDPGYVSTDTDRNSIFDAPSFNNQEDYKRLVWNIGIGYPF